MELVNSDGYGLWSLVVSNSLIFIFFAFIFTKFNTKRNWLIFILFSVFIIAHFTEMYGFPFTIYFFPKLTNHLLYAFTELQRNFFFIIATTLLVLFGTLLLILGWATLHEAQYQKRLAVTGPYVYVRHPQYLGFTLIMIGLILQWPTFITLILFSLLVAVYVRLSYREEKEMMQEFGDRYKKYIKNTPMFIPRISKIGTRK